MELAAGLRFRRFLPVDAVEMVSWRYLGLYSAYNLDPQDSNVLRELMRPQNHYHAILRNEELVGFFCWGADARVPGFDYDDDALDVGMGLSPALSGKGEGQMYLRAVLAEIDSRSPKKALRATIAAWNERAIRMCVTAGFRKVQKFTATGRDQREFVVLLRERSAD